MFVKVKKLISEAIIPQYAKAGDAGLDLTATSVSMDEQGNVVYGTGLAFEIPEGYVGLIFPRSSNSKKDLYLTNHVGVIDSGYRGEVSFKFRPTVRPYFHEGQPEIYKVGERVGQLIVLPYPQIVLVETDTLSDTERGASGFGSSGK
jgi:dUTP pyrophosphatase